MSDDEYHPTSPMPHVPFPEVDAGEAAFFEESDVVETVGVKSDNETRTPETTASFSFPRGHRVKTLQVSLEQKKSKTCSFFLKGGCHFGARCLFFHPPESIEPSVDDSKRLRKHCQMEGCLNSVRFDVCNRCCDEHGFCINRPCANLRTNSGSEPNLCQECFTREMDTDQPVKMCRNVKCYNRCLSFRTWCNTCFTQQRPRKCFTSGCSQMLQNVRHRYCSACFGQQALPRRPRHGAHHPYKRGTDSGGRTNRKARNVVDERFHESR